MLACVFVCVGDDACMYVCVCVRARAHADMYLCESVCLQIMCRSAGRGNEILSVVIRSVGIDKK